jgi:DNA polymerase III sliding clamp (beta) subunit (PCNA family)
VGGGACDGDGEIVRMFNSDYLLDGLSGAGTQMVRVGFQDSASKPMLFTACDGDPDDGPGPDPAYRYLVVPLRKVA